MHALSIAAMMIAKVGLAKTPDEISAVGFLYSSEESVKLTSMFEESKRLHNSQKS